MRMSRDEFSFQSPYAIDQIDQGGQALRRVPLGIGQSGAKVLLVHRALSDHRVDGVARDYAGGYCGQVGTSKPDVSPAASMDHLRPFVGLLKATKGRKLSSPGRVSVSTT